MCVCVCVCVRGWGAGGVVCVQIKLTSANFHYATLC